MLFLHIFYIFYSGLSDLSPVPIIITCTRFLPLRMNLDLLSIPFHHDDAHILPVVEVAVSVSRASSRW